MNKIAEMKALIKTLNEASNVYYNGAKESTLTDEQFEYNHLCSGELITTKINELVDAVNETRDK